MATSYQGGDDVVFNFQPLMQTIANNAQYEQNRIKEQRKQRDQIQQQATKDLSKINANGLWNADLPQFNEMYNGLKETYYQLSKVSDNDPDKARELSMELASRMSQVDAFVAQSQDFSSNYSKSLDGVKNLVGKGRAQEYKDHLLSLSNKPSTELGRDMLDSSPYIYTYDPNKVATRVQRLAKDMLSSVSPISQSTGTYTTSGGKRYDTIQQTKEVGTTQSFESLSNLAKRDREVGAYVQDLMDNEGLDFNGAINYMQEEFADNFRQITTTDRSADKPAPRTTNITIAMPSEAVDANSYQISLGNFTSQESRTYTEDIPLIGSRDVFSKEGEKSNIAFRDVTLKGQALMRLPVDSNGDPLPTDKSGNPRNSNQVAGYREFVAGTVPQSDVQSMYSGLPPIAQQMLREEILVPTSQIQWIGQSARRQNDLRGLQNQASQTQTTNRPKFN